jgi:prepilin peptidase CpaA
VNLWIVGVAVLMSFAAAAFDIRTRRIPNAFPLALAILGIAGAAVMNGWQGVLWSIVCVLLIVAIGAQFHARGFVGGGDIKLLAGGAAVVGPAGLVPFFAICAFAGGGLAVVTALQQRRLVTTMRHLSLAVAVPGSGLVVSTEHRPMPYGVAIALGLLGVLLLHSLHKGSFFS